MKELVLPKNRWYSLVRKRQAITTGSYTEQEKAWDKLVVSNNSAPHYMQSSAWSESKTHSSWPVSRLVISTGKKTVLPMQVFSRTVPGLGRLHYAPRVNGISKGAIPYITKQVKSQYKRGMVFKLEPYQPYSEALIEAFEKNGWKIAYSVQYHTSVVVDLSGSEQDLFLRLKKRARYEVRLAQRNNVRIEKVQVTKEKLNLLLSLLHITAKRSGAFFRSKKYMKKYWQTFATTGQGTLYFVWHDFDLLAGAYVVRYGDRAWYKDGGSVRHKANFMGSRLLQWEIMKDLQAQGVKHYDLSGIPAKDELETSSMKGLYTFKTGFSDETVHYMPAIELPLSKGYKFWAKAEREFLRLYSGFRKDFWY